MGLNSTPFSLDDIDPSEDFFRKRVTETDSDDFQAGLVPPDRIHSGDIWYVRAVFSGVTVADEAINEGYLVIGDGTNYAPSIDDSATLASIYIQDSDTGGIDVCEAYIPGDEISDGNAIAFGAYFPDTAFDGYGTIGGYAEAVRVRRGHDLTPNAFGPGQTVETYDGTTNISATFAEASVNSDQTDAYDTDNDGVDDTVDFGADIPEYQNADNPVLGFEVKLNGTDGGSYKWPTEWTELDETLSLPQSANYDSWPLTAVITGNQELPEPTQYQNQSNEERYEVRAVVWEAGEKADTKVVGTDTYEVGLYAVPAALQ